MTSNCTPDWSRETSKGWSPSRSLLSAIRSYQDAGRYSGPRALFRRRLAVVRHRFWSVVTGADIPINCTLGGGLLMPHPNGIVIHPQAEIGPNCLIFQQVTIGANGRGVPKIGGHVDIGAGAKIIGPVTVGNDVLIGANAVVTTDVPANSTAVGIPARIVPRSKSESHL